MSSDSKTKYLVLVPDGMADPFGHDQNEITPLTAAKTPWMDKMASLGTVGMARTVPKDMSPGSDVANLSIMGYSPKDIYTGRAPFEAASMGVGLGENDVAFRLNLVTLERNFSLMADHSADHIGSAEAREIVASLAPLVESLGLHLVAGISYRHLLVWTDGPVNCVTHPPHDFLGQTIHSRLPSGEGSDLLLRLIIRSWKLLEQHPVNLRRVQRGQKPANSVWPWGQGRPPKIQTFFERFGKTGAVVAAVDLVKGIGDYAGLKSIEVPGATGYLDTNYQGKVEAALEVLTDRDFVFLHVEAPDEAGHSGQRDLKIKAIEDFDEKIAGPVLEGLKSFDTWRILLMPDHQTPVSTRVHSSEPVPFIILDSAQWDPGKETVRPFTEAVAHKAGLFVPDASKLMSVLLERETLSGISEGCH